MALARDTIAGWTTALGKFAGSGSLLGFRSESRDLSVAGRDPGWQSFSPRVLIVGTARLSAASGDFPASLIVNPESFEHAGRDVPCRRRAFEHGRMGCGGGRERALHVGYVGG